MLLQAAKLLSSRAERSLRRQFERLVVLDYVIRNTDRGVPDRLWRGHSIATWNGTRLAAWAHFIAAMLNSCRNMAAIATMLTKAAGGK